MKATIYIISIVFLLIFFSLKSIGQIKPELSPSPPMGWNSWNWFGKHEINEKTVLEVIDAMAETGLRDAGYNYIVIDGGWRDTILGTNGELIPHPVKFPNGIKPLADYAHSKGFKFGLHTVPGTHDCGGDPVGGFNKEEIHIQQFIDWGLDFVKVDMCRQTADTCQNCVKSKTGWSEELIRRTYEKWSTLLNNCGRDIVFSISAYQYREWYPELCNMSRTTYDIAMKHNKGGAVFNSENRENRGPLSVMAIAEINNQYANYAGNGFWNDPDMMVTGDQGLTIEEQQSHFCLWSVISAPLFIGSDPREMSQNEKKLLMNKEVIAVNQDPTEQGILVEKGDEYQIWKKKLIANRFAILILNMNPVKDKMITLNFKNVNLPETLQLRDALIQNNLGEFNKNFSTFLAPHGCSLLIVSY